MPHGLIPVDRPDLPYRIVRRDTGERYSRPNLFTQRAPVAEKSN